MAALVTRARSATGAGTLVILALVLAFGNQAFVEWAGKHAQGRTSWDLFLRTLAWPQWRLTSGEDTPRSVIALDLRALLLIVLVAALLGIGGATVRGGFGAFSLGWFSVIIGGAVAALLTAFITTDASLYTGLISAGEAAVYGLLVGWIVGLATSAARRPVAAAA